MLFCHGTVRTLVRIGYDAENDVYIGASESRKDG